MGNDVPNYAHFTPTLEEGADEEDEMTVGEMPVSESGSKKRKRHDSETHNDIGQITELLDR